MTDLRKVEVLMYSGRDGHSLSASLPRDTSAMTVAVLAGKTPLAEDLAEGLGRAERSGIDLEQLF